MKLKSINQKLANILEKEQEEENKPISPKAAGLGTNHQHHIKTNHNKWTPEKYQPTNTEIAFLEKIHFRDLDDQKAENIALKDFSIPKESYDNLKDVGLIKFLQDGRSISLYKESDEMLMSRAWVSLCLKEGIQNIPSFIKKPDDKKLDDGKLDELAKKCAPHEMNVVSKDYSIYFKRLKGEALSKTEDIRLRSLVRNGVLPESHQFKEWIKTSPKGWRLRNERIKAITNHLTATKEINIEALKFVNTFKQVTPTQLAKYLKSDPEKVESYLKNLDDTNEFTQSSKLLKQNTLNAPNGKIPYLSINHVGDLNGRKVLQQFINKKEINSKPQLRPDLLYHDLKVVDSVLQIKEEIEKDGGVIKRILNESAQYSTDKTGKQNNQRDESISYMDAVIEVEKKDPITGETRTEKIAIEYGNYTIERMQSKLNNSSFNKAYVFSNAKYTKSYQKNISTNKNVTFRAI